MIHTFRLVLCNLILAAFKNATFEKEREGGKGKKLNWKCSIANNKWNSMGIMYNAIDKRKRAITCGI